MLCYRCGSHVQDGAEKCWNCDTRLASTSKAGASLEELRERQRTKSRISGVVYKIGDLIANRYKVRDIAGSGGAGVVYRAHDQEIDVDVALKVINAKLLQTPEEKKLFSREVKAARKLNHQNIVRIYDEARDGDRVFYTMQFLEGLSLRKIIDLRKEKKQHFALAEIEPIYNQLCQALDYAHRSTLHGNLKPDNVIVLPDLLKVTDFGLIRGLPRKPFLAIQKTRTPNFQYLAPEVRLEVEDLSNAADIFSLGVVLGEMLTGQVIDESKPEQLTVAKTGLDSAVLRVIRRALLRAPKERYTSAGELYEDLRSILARGDGRASPEEAANVQVEPSLASPSQPPPGPTRVLENGPPVIEGAQRRSDPSEVETEAPTQRLDISRHGQRPVVDDLAEGAVRRVEPEGGTGTFSPIEDDMIEESSGSPSSIHVVGSSLEVPPLAEEEKSGDVDEGEEETEALDNLQELSASEIVLVADPRATNVIEVDQQKGSAQIKKPTVSDAPPLPVVSRPAPAAPSRADNVVVVEMPPPMPHSGSIPPVPLPGQVAGYHGASVPEPAFARANEPTAAGRLDGVPPRMLEKKDDRRHQATSPVIRGVPPGEEGRVQLRSPEEPPKARPSKPAIADVVTVAPAAGLVDPQIIPRSPTTAMPPANGSSANGSAINGRAARSRPATRPRMAALRTNPPLSSSSLFDAFPQQAEPPRDPTGARPLVVDGQGVHTRPPTMTGIEPAFVSPEQKSRKLLLFAGLAVAVFVIAGLFGMIFVMMDQNKKLMDQLGQRIAQEKSVAAAAAQNESQAAKEKEDAALKAKEAQDAEKQAQALAEEARKRAETDRIAAEEAEKQKRADAAEKRKAAEESAKREKEQLAIADTETKKREREEQRQKNAEEREARERAARIKAEERAERLKAEQESLAEKKAEAAEKKAEAALVKKAEDEAKKAEAAEAAKKKADDEAKRKAEEAEAKKAEELASKKEGEGPAAAAAGIAAVAPAAKECPKGMVYIDTGDFMMGAPRNDPERNFGDLQYASVGVPGYCIDYYEAPNGRGRAPTAKISYGGAEKACKSKGKRLCSEPEWEKACKGPSGLRYPYGNQWDPAACATEDDEGNDREIAKSGSFERCRSGFNVLDLSGNIAEWTSSAWPGGGGYVVKGGSSDRPGYDGRCAARKKKPGNSVDERIGYRCCADPK